MMNREHLHLLIDEEIYRIPDRDSHEVTEEVNQEVVNDELIDSETIHVSKEELDHEHHHETPHVPEVHHEDLQEESKIPFAVFHESNNPAEIELLQKIISACQLENDQYQVFANGFNKEVKFEKALVFVKEAKAFYQPIPYQDSLFLCAKPLNELAANQQEKAKLWNSLQEFLALN